MAIFKPVNCTPYANSFDITKEIPYYFECEIDCTNKQKGLDVIGYSITILNEDNIQVFPTNNRKPVDNISLISDLKNINSYITNPNGYYKLNTGLNGTYLRIPVIVNNNWRTAVGVDDTKNSSLMLNQINVDGEGYEDNPIL
jgi:hypothetical protein